MAYTTKAKIEDFLNLDIDGSLNATITTWIGWIQKWIDNYCQTTFEASAEVRYYDGIGGNRLIIDDFVSVSQIDFLDVDGTVDETLGSDDYWTYPMNEDAKFEIRLNPYGDNPVFPIGSNRIKINGTWGNTTSVPADVEWVATAMVADIIRRQTNVGRNTKDETLGEYSVTFDDIQTFAMPEYLITLDRYKKINV